MLAFSSGFFASDFLMFMIDGYLIYDVFLHIAMLCVIAIIHVGILYSLFVMIATFL